MNARSWPLAALAWCGPAAAHGVEGSVIAHALLEPVGGVANLAALLALGLVASRLGGAWPHGLPALLGPALLAGLVIGYMAPELHGLAHGGVLAALSMTAVLVALPGPHGALGAAAAALLLGLSHGHAGGLAAQDGGPAVLVFVLMSVGLYVVGAACGALSARPRKADPRVA
jgi:hypothetical protein